MTTLASIERHCALTRNPSAFPSHRPPTPTIGIQGTRYTGAAPIRVQLARQLRTSGGMVHVAATHAGPTMLMAPTGDPRDPAVAPPRNDLLALLRDAALSQRDLSSATDIARKLGAGWKRAAVCKALADLSRACNIKMTHNGTGVVVTIAGCALTTTIGRAPASLALAA